MDEESGKLIITGTGSASIGGVLPWADFADKITSIEIGADVTDVDTSIFDGLTGLTDITVHEDNPDYTSKDGVLFSKDMTVLVKHPGGVAEYTVPETVTTIGDKAFSGCDELKKILFAGNMPKFGSDCFLGVTAEAFYPYDNDTWTEAGLQNYGGSITWTEQGRVIASGECGVYGAKVYWELEVTGTLRVFGDGKMVRQPNYSFRAWDPYCSQIIRVVVENGVTNVAAQAFSMCSSIRSVTLADSVTEIGESSFRDCTDLEKVDLPESIKTIDSRAFEDCLSLEQINLPDNIVSIGSSAFYNCDGLREINIPSNIGVIERTTFFDCDSIVKVTIPAMVTSIKEDAFSVCDSLNEIVFEGSAPKMVDGYYGSFYNVTATVYYPADDSTWTLAVRKNYGGKLTWVPYAREYGHEEVTQITAGKIEIQSGEELVLSAILNPGVQTDAEIIWNVEKGSAYASLKTNGAVATLTAGNVTEKTTVTVTAKVADGAETARITITILPKPAEEPADYEIFSGKSLTLKPINPDTGKAYTSKQLTWSMDSCYDAFATLKNGKVTAKVVLEKVRTEVKATVVATGEELSYLIDIYPAATQLEVSCDGEVVNGKTVSVDYTRNTLVLTADAYPLDTLENIQWSISDSKKLVYAEDYIISGNTVTVVNPTGKAGTVTVKATVNAGTKKNVTVKLQFAGFAKEVRIAAPTETTIEGGDSLQLYAAIPGGASKPGITWSIPDKADKAAASISGKGLLKAKKVKQPEVVTIVATSKDGKAQDSIEITIVPADSFQPYLTDSKGYVSGTTKSMNTGDTWKLDAWTEYYGNMAEKMYWSSSKSSVATVSSNGLITAVGPGTAKITADYLGDKVSVTVKVTTLVSDMTISTKDGKNLVQENGETMVEIASSKGATLAATVYPAKANKAVAWEIVEGAAYAKISSSGKVTANKDLTSVKYVTVKATAKDGSGYSETIRVRIRPLGTGVQIYSQQNGRTTFSVRTPENWWVRSNTTLTVDLDDTKTLQLLSHVYPYYGEDNARNAIQDVTWKSSSSKIAAIDENGNVTFYKTGTVTITATAKDGSNKKVTFKLKIV